MDSVLNSYIIVWFAMVGLCMGSFFNVVILRSLSGESIVFPSSKCPKCGNKLKIWHNIPVLSYIVLGGKCGFCKEKISIQYPLIELLTMGLYIATYLKFGLTWQTLFVIILLSGMLIMSMTDLKEKVVDCNIAIGIAIIGFIYNFITSTSLLDSLYGLLAGVVILEIIARSGYLIVKDRALGEADTYIAGALGACFGLTALFKLLLYTLFASMIFIVPMFLYKQFKQNNKLTCVLFILFILSVLAFKTLYQNYWTFGALSISGLFLCFSILKNLKKDSEPLYLPLVPSFGLATLYFLFF